MKKIVKLLLFIMFCTIGYVSFYSTKIMAEEVPVTQAATVDETQTVEDTGRQQTDVETNNASVSEADTQNQMEDKGRVATNSVSVETTSPTTSDKVIICLDPGHGGSDSGAISVVGTYEKTLNLKIAEYCREELEKYNCEVVMTRESDTRLSENTGVDLYDRVLTAKNAGASYIISLHLNAGPSSAYGGVVFYPNGNYRPELGSAGKVLAQSIENELVKLGIYNRGIEIRNIGGDVDYAYADGSDGDYYAIIRNAKQENLVGLIVEHCFVSNYSDYQNYLNTDEKLRQLGLADATGIINALGLTQINRQQVDALAQENANVLEDGIYEIQSGVDSNYVINVVDQSTVNSANVQVYQTSGITAQLWSVIHDANGYVTFINVNSGKALDVTAAKAVNGANIQQYTQNNTYAQKWIVKNNETGYTIVSGIDGLMVLDLNAGKAVNGSNVQLYAANGTLAQTWNVVALNNSSYQTIRSRLNALATSNKNVCSDGIYVIQTIVNPNYVLDVTGGSLNNGANVQIYRANGTDAQSWKVSHDSQGYVIFTNMRSGKTLDVVSGVAKAGTNVQQYTSKSNYGQKWIVLKKTNGYMIISAIDDHYVLDLVNATAKNQNNIQLNTIYSSNGQIWNFEPFKPMRERLDETAIANKNLIADGTYVIQSKINPNYVLDVTGGSLDNGANVQLYRANGTDAQSWKITHDTLGYVTLINVKSGKVLDVTAAKAGNGSNVQQYTSNNTYAQKWIIKNSANGYILVSGLNDQYVLDLNAAKAVNGSNIQIYTSNDTLAQRWNVVVYKPMRERLDETATANKNLIADGIYVIQSKINPNYVLDVTGGSLDNGANVQLYRANGTDAQSWKITHDTLGYVTLINVKSGKVLDVTAAKAGNGSNVQQYTSNNTYAQKWIIKNSANGYILVSGLNDQYVLYLNAAKAVNGSNIQIYTSNDTLAQRWLFQSIAANNVGQADALHPIMGTTLTTVDKMAAVLKHNNASYDRFPIYGTIYDGVFTTSGASTIHSFCQIYFNEAAAEGVRAEVAFAQAMLETNWLRFGGDVLPNQYNFAGLGATGDGVHGNVFTDVVTGIRAQIQHLKCYASTEPLNKALVDQRWSNALRAQATTVEHLSIPNNPNGKGWASDKNYANGILSIMNQLI